MAVPDPDDLEFARAFVAANHWTYAVTYAKSAPHEYVVRDKLSPALKSDYDRFARLIVAVGHIENFYRQARPYWVLDGWKYWWMENIINRDDNSRVYGEQVASRTNTDKPINDFDRMAADWDTRVPPLVKPAEAVMVQAALEPDSDRGILDVGCGTGSLIRLLKPRPSGYLGVDPSSGMCNVHVFKHPAHRVAALTLAEYAMHPAAHPWTTVAALNGAASYLTPDEVEIASELADENLYLMFFGPTMTPPVPYNHDGLAAALELPGIEKRELGRWTLIARSSRLC